MNCFDKEMVVSDSKRNRQHMEKKKEKEKEMKESCLGTFEVHFSHHYRNVPRAIKTYR